MKPIVRSTILFFAMVFLGGAVFAWFDVLTHDSILTNPELKFATGWLMTGNGSLRRFGNAVRLESGETLSDVLAL